MYELTENNSILINTSQYTFNSIFGSSVSTGIYENQILTVSSYIQQQRNNFVFKQNASGKFIDVQLNSATTIQCYNNTSILLNNIISRWTYLNYARFFIVNPNKYYNV